MTLLVISHTRHYRGDGGIVGWAPTVREIDRLATLFERVIHLAPVHPGEAPASAVPYESPNVELRLVRPAGGPSILEKLGALAAAPLYALAILRELKSCDVVHVRCPANIGAVAIALLAVVPRGPVRWVKYAGNWRPDGHDPWSYRLQRLWLARGLHRGFVTVNGRWPDQPAHVRAFLNPCLTDEELAAGQRAAAAKQIDGSLRVLLAGRLDPAKGAHRVVEAVGRLRAAGITASADIVGDGPARKSCEEQAAAAGLGQLVQFHGWLPRSALASYYETAHFVALPSDSEGWPKVLSEGMAYGAVPVAGAVGSIPETLAGCATGRAIHPHDAAALAEALAWYAAHPGAWKRESENAARAAARFTYSTYISAVRDMLGLK